MIDFETRGYYEPGLFHLRVNVDFHIKDLNELSKNPQVFSTFLHEYVHFIQNITTTSGLMSIVLYVDLIKDFNWNIINAKAPRYKVPYQITDKNVLANTEIMPKYQGDGSGASLCRYDRYFVETDLMIDKFGNKFNVKKYKIFYYDLHSRQVESRYFGSTCLKEYVAHVVQTNFFPGISHPDFPYTIAQQVLTKEHPLFPQDQNLILTLCDACLMSYHPAQMFFETLERMKLQAYVPTTSEDIYEFTFKDITFHGPGRVETYVSLFSAQHQLASSQVSDALASDIFNPNLKWIKHVLLEGYNLRLQDPTFMSKLVLKEGVLTDLFYEIFGKLGSPFFTNKLEQGSFIAPDDLKDLAIFPFQLKVFKEILFVHLGQQSCKMYDFCRTRTDKDITNSHCKSAPWRRVKEDELCPFGQLWKTWGLKDFEPYR